MKKFIQWLAKAFNANITVEKEIVKTMEKKVEVPVEVIKEVVKEVEVERPIYVVGTTMTSDAKLVEGDVVIDGDLTVKGNLYVSGGVTCLNDTKVMKSNDAKKKGGKK